MGENSSQGSLSPLPGSMGEDPDKTPSHPSSRGDDLDDPENNDKGSNQRRGRSKNRIDSDSDDSTNKNSGMRKDIKVVGEFNMKLRGQKDFEEISLRTDNPRKRSRKDMESTSSQPKARPTQTPQGEKILYSRPWTPVYFTQSGAKQTPSYPVEFTKKCDGKMKKFRSEGVEGEHKRRVIRRPQKF